MQPVSTQLEGVMPRVPEPTIEHTIEPTKDSAMNMGMIFTWPQIGGIVSLHNTLLGRIKFQTHAIIMSVQYVQCIGCRTYLVLRQVRYIFVCSGTG